ncbi:MAG: SdpI family protein [Chitinophagaceae bacterium]
MKKNNTHWIWVIIFITIPFLYAGIEYNNLPDTIPIHFNISGEADGWGSKENIFMMPAIMGIVSLIVFSILSNLKKIDPKRYEKSGEGYFRNFGIFSVLFLSIISMTIIYSTIHPSGVGANKLIFPIIGLGISGLGFFMPKIPQNYFVGIRLPWTLESRENWEATHTLGGKIWIAGGIGIIATSFLIKPEIFGIIFLIFIAIMVLIPVFYSYRMFRASKKN